MRQPSISVVIPAYNAEAFISEAVEAVLGQTRAPDEVIVVDDGSTDGTLDVLHTFGKSIQVIRQRNGGAGAAYSRGFSIATSSYVARCDADDVWEPWKLAQQADSLAHHPQVDVAFAAAVNFGNCDGPWDPPLHTGLLDTASFARELYQLDTVCASTAVVRRKLFGRLGPFVSPHPCEDYEYWLRALKSGATFYYDPSVLVRYRRHSHNVTNDLLRMYRGIYQVHRWHADLVDDRHFVRGVLADDRFRIVRWLFENGEPRRAQRAVVASLRHGATPRELGWALALSAPRRLRQPMIDGFTSLKHGLAAAG